MRRLTFIFIAILALVAGLAQSGLADTITIYTMYADANVLGVFTGSGNTLNVPETYGEHYLIPYSSHDGQAVVDASNRFFDKQVNPVVGAGNPQITFVVTNSTPYTWSDYHFLIYTQNQEPFSTPLAILSSASVISPYLQTINYLSSSPGPYTGVEFYEPSPVAPGQTVTFVLNFTSYTSPFGIRQIATTEVPLPGAAWLLGGGLAGLLGFRGFRRRS